MNLYGSLHKCSINMMIIYLSIGTHALHPFHHRNRVSICPQINVAGRPHHRIGIHQRIALPLEDDRAHAPPPFDVLTQDDTIVVHLLVLLLYFEIGRIQRSHGELVGQMVGIAQLLHTMEEHTHDRLSDTELQQFGPHYLIQTFKLRSRVVKAKAHKAETDLSLLPLLLLLKIIPSAINKDYACC
jgi:hypothetical protein